MSKMKRWIRDWIWLEWNEIKSRKSKRWRQTNRIVFVCFVHSSSFISKHSDHEHHDQILHIPHIIHKLGARYTVHGYYFIELAVLWFGHRWTYSRFNHLKNLFRAEAWSPRDYWSSFRPDKSIAFPIVFLFIQVILLLMVHNLAVYIVMPLVEHTFENE